MFLTNRLVSIVLLCLVFFFFYLCYTPAYIIYICNNDVFKWHARFKTRSDYQRLGQIMTKRQETWWKIGDFIYKDCRRTTHQLSHMIEISYKVR